MSLVPADRAPDALRPLRHAVAALDDQRAALAETGDWETLVYGLASLAPLLRDLRDLERAIKSDIAGLLPSKQVTVEGVGVVERRNGGSDRKDWDWERLLPTLIRLYVDPDGNGEVPEPGEVMDRMRKLIVDVIGVTPSKGPKITPLREMGLDPDEWCASIPKPPSVQIHGGEK